MIFTIYNLPLNATYSEIKSFIYVKCGLSPFLIDNLVKEGDKMKVNVCLADEHDAAILIQEINGFYLHGVQLYVEDHRKNKNLLYNQSEYLNISPLMQIPLNDMQIVPPNNINKISNNIQSQRRRSSKTRSINVGKRKCVSPPPEFLPDLSPSDQHNWQTFDILIRDVLKPETVNEDSLRQREFVQQKSCHYGSVVDNSTNQIRTEGTCNRDGHRLNYNSENSNYYCNMPQTNIRSHFNQQYYDSNDYLSTTYNERLFKHRLDENAKSQTKISLLFDQPYYHSNYNYPPKQNFSPHISNKDVTWRQMATSFIAQNIMKRLHNEECVYKSSILKNLKQVIRHRIDNILGNRIEVPHNIIINEYYKKFVGCDQSAYDTSVYMFQLKQNDNSVPIDNKKSEQTLAQPNQPQNQKQQPTKSQLAQSSRITIKKPLITKKIPVNTTDGSTVIFKQSNIIARGRKVSLNKKQRTKQIALFKELDCNVFRNKNSEKKRKRNINKSSNKNEIRDENSVLRDEKETVACLEEDIKSRNDDKKLHKLLTDRLEVKEIKTECDIDDYNDEDLEDY